MGKGDNSNNPCREATPEEMRLQSYLTRVRDRDEALAPWLARVDMEALSKVEEAFQKEMHDALYALRMEDQAGILEVMGWIKGAHALMVWMDKAQKRVGG